MYQIENGTSSPLGVTKIPGGFNFAVYAAAEKDVFLHLFSTGEHVPFAKIPMQRTESIWHVAVKNLHCLFDYGIFIDNHLLIDPYARNTNASNIWGDPFYNEYKPLGRYSESSYDWEGDSPPNLPFQDLIIYEMHLRGYTEDPSSHVKHPGTFLGMIEKIPHLKELGINAVELMPIFEFDECDNPRKNPKTGKKLFNYWGYNTINFFSLMNRFGTIDDFKTLVKELHKNKIEVILDVVYNHTGEGNESGRTFSFRGLDNKTYYILGPKGEYYNYSGCGNTFNCNVPVVTTLIVDSLRYWVTEMHVDGFRFDLASILTRDPQGQPLGDPPVVKKITEDPLLKNVKLIAEAWDAAGLYQVGHFPAYGKWAEWNGRYRDAVRLFIKGTDGVAGAFAGALAGSQDLYGNSNRKPYHSINFVTAHDGFTLHDLVSYNQKHNEANGENNQDGANDNESWNCGHEGETSNIHILQLRQRQMKNFLVALFVSLGTPMVLMGDEYGHTHSGNNNTWCHDGPPNAFLWNKLPQEKNLLHFWKSLIHLRRTNPLLRRAEFLKPEDIDWHGTVPFHPDWGPTSRFVSYTLKDHNREHHLYIAFNATPNRPNIQLPPPPSHKKWYRLVDTALAPPHDFMDHPTQQPPLKTMCRMEGYSSLILIAQ